MIKKLLKIKKSKKPVPAMVYQRHEMDFMSTAFAVLLPDPSHLEKAVAAISGGKKKVPKVDVRIGFAIQSPKDAYNKKKAREVACKRLRDFEMAVETVSFKNNGARVGEALLSTEGGKEMVRLRFYADNVGLYRVVAAASAGAGNTYIQVHGRNYKLIEAKRQKAAENGAGKEQK